jgi:hypothetical protein
MAKKRKTRKEKIILQLKRELARQQPKTDFPDTKSQPRQEAKSPSPGKKSPRLVNQKKSNKSTFSTDSGFLRKDLTKTAILSLLALSLSFMLYLILG